MTHIFLLPPEILLLIYLTLRNIDDALHLARCCRQINHIFESRRLEILKHIIECADHHVHDSPLYYQVRLHGCTSRELYTIIGKNWRVEEHKAIVDKCYELSMASSPAVSTEIIWETVARWGAMRVLFDLYCDASVQNTYCRSIYPCDFARNDRKFIQDLGESFRHLSGQVCNRFHCLDGKQRQRAYKRFYKAITAHWKKVEQRWLTKCRVYRDAENATDAIEKYVAGFMEFESDSHSLQGRLDILEVTDFVWSFLGRKALHMTGPWMDEFNKSRDDIVWMAMSNIIEHSRPVNIIELVLMSPWG
ncbi:hypothetical protein BO78DRAFT_384857 [Aspergillus sclerotiicarbonarius CBS 121057]|uniref:F-box domain-containing protein n=1 Tax=Aspergillus sclerotiicarbonarius (strain CBS 121057 / IBT 28362) TaxID=1448318 RepID=A0A319EEU2_ASPSB|nr:hypothetical protein BO78DRAFT_384857 [Aspergillus sclerotiicarbonarius CBS 121057]